MTYINFITVAVGQKYGPDYPNAVYNMVRKHYNGKHKIRFYCVTDHKSGLNPDINVIRPLSSYKIPGWWNKLYLFTPLMPKGRLVYIDLDVVIVNDISELIDNYDGPFCGDEDHLHFGAGPFREGKPKYGIPPIDCSLGTAFIMMDSGHGRHIWTHYLKNQKMVHEAFNRHGDQVYISWQLDGKFDLLEDIYPLNHGFCSYRFNILGEKVAGVIRPEVKPWHQWRMINFHGSYKPMELKDKYAWIQAAYAPL